MANRKTLINNHYNNYDEDNRLIKDNTHNVEFLVTKNYIEKYLKENDKILEVGAGTGRYSLHYASKGYDVTAIEFVQHNLDILTSKIKKDMKIVAEQGDAVDLSRFKDNTFDITLVLGPLYHLYEDDDIRKAISEAIRVTKKDGIIMIAYITSDGVFADLVVDNLLDSHPYEYDQNFKLRRYPEGIFAPFYIKEFKEIMNEFNIDYLHNLATDGIVNIISDKINKLSAEEFKVWVKYQLSVCEREDLQGYSCHMLYVCKKK
ncbi:MAG: methyltransferase domain-containing protein [Clostridia bacterium]|nr:methyltransferase domain-containing protein [Clostridia bacterium]